MKTALTQSAVKQIPNKHCSQKESGGLTTEKKIVKYYKAVHLVKMFTLAETTAVSCTAIIYMSIYHFNLRQIDFLNIQAI